MIEVKLLRLKRIRLKRYGLRLELELYMDHHCHRLYRMRVRAVLWRLLIVLLKASYSLLNLLKENIMAYQHRMSHDED